VPAITINRARQVLGVTHRAASLNIDRLMSAGILREVPARGRTRMFIAPEILSVADGNSS
jgi:hypothetical protein